jgi:Cache domain.
MMRDFFSVFISLKYKFFIATLLLVIAFNLLTSFLWFLRSTEDAEKTAAINLSETLRISNENFNIALRDINYIVSMASINSDIIGILSKRSYDTNQEYIKDERKISDYLVGIYSNSYKQYLGSLMISDLKGRDYSLGLSISLGDIKKVPGYSDIIKADTDKVFLAPHYNGFSKAGTSDYDYNSMVLSIARPILNNKTIVGIVVADIKCRILLDIFNINMKNNGTILVMNNNSGEVIFMPDPKKLDFKMSSCEFRKISSMFGSEKGSFNLKLNGRDFIIVYDYSGIVPEGING